MKFKLTTVCRIVSDEYSDLPKEIGINTIEELKEIAVKFNHPLIVSFGETEHEITIYNGYVE